MERTLGAAKSNGASSTAVPRTLSTHSMQPWLGNQSAKTCVWYSIAQEDGCKEDGHLMPPSTPRMQASPSVTSTSCQPGTLPGFLGTSWPGSTPATGSTTSLRSRCNTPPRSGKAGYHQPSRGASRTTSNADFDSPDQLAVSSSVYDSTFIDAYDAVQNLEQTTSAASHAMDLLDAALQVGLDHKGKRPSSVRTLQDSPHFAWPSGSDISAPRAQEPSVPSAVQWTPTKSFPRRGDTPPRQLATRRTVTSPHKIRMSTPSPNPTQITQREVDKLLRPITPPRNTNTNGTVEYIGWSPSQNSNEDNEKATATTSDVQREPIRAFPSLTAREPVIARNVDEQSNRSMTRGCSVASVSSGEVSIAPGDLYGS